MRCPVQIRIMKSEIRSLGRYQAVGSKSNSNRSPVWISDIDNNTFIACNATTHIEVNSTFREVTCARKLPIFSKLSAMNCTLRFR